MSFEIEVEKKEWVPGQECVQLNFLNPRDEDGTMPNLKELEVNLSIPKAEQLRDKLIEVLKEQ